MYCQLKFIHHAFSPQPAGLCLYSTAECDATRGLYNTVIDVTVCEAYNGRPLLGVSRVLG